MAFDKGNHHAFLIAEFRLIAFIIKLLPFDSQTRLEALK